jgi:hypothetical protein
MRIKTPTTRTLTQPNDYANNWSMIKRHGADTLENLRPFRDPQNMYGFSNFTVTVRQPKRRQQLIEQFENPLWFQTLLETFWGLGIVTIDNNHRFKAKYRLPTANKHPLNWSIPDVRHNNTSDEIKIWTDGSLRNSLMGAGITFTSIRPNQQHYLHMLPNYHHASARRLAILSKSRTFCNIPSPSRLRTTSRPGY